MTNEMKNENQSLFSPVVKDKVIFAPKDLKIKVFTFFSPSSSTSNF